MVAYCQLGALWVHTKMQYVLITRSGSYSADGMLPISILMNSQFILTPGKHSSKWVPNENRIKKMNSRLKVTLGEQSLKCGTKRKLHGYAVSHLRGRAK
jgi:hypothetical protein